MVIRCVIDNLLLPAEIREEEGGLVAYDGEDSFTLEALEALYYELVSATPEEMVGLEHFRYRLLRRADDFQCEFA
jgi:hypothetical protein